MNFGQLIEYSMGNIFLEKSCAKYSGLITFFKNHWISGYISRSTVFSLIQFVFLLHEQVEYYQYVLPVQVPQWNAPWWLPRSINLAKTTSPVPNYASPPINNFSTSAIKRLYPRQYLEKLVVPTEIEYFQHGPRSSN